MNYIKFSKFEDLDDFRDSLLRGREIVFEYNGKEYGIFLFDDGIYVAVHWKDHVKAVHAQSPGGVYDWKLSGVLLLFLCQHPAPVLRDSSLYRIF